MGQVQLPASRNKSSILNMTEYVRSRILLSVTNASEATGSNGMLEMTASVICNENTNKAKKKREQKNTESMIQILARKIFNKFHSSLSVCHLPKGHKHISAKKRTNNKPIRSANDTPLIPFSLR